MSKKLHNTMLILCHPQDGGPFCNHHKTAHVYACYFFDTGAEHGDPPAPETLGIEHRSVADVSAMVWQPVVQVVGEPVDDVEVYGEYDEDGATI